MEPFQVERSTRKKTTALLPSWEGRRRAVAGPGWAPARAAPHLAAPHLAARLASRFRRAAAKGGPRATAAPGVAEPQETRGCGFLSPGQAWRESERAFFGFLGCFLLSSWELPEWRWSTESVLSLDGQDEDGHKWFRRSQDAGGEYRALQT